MELPNLAPSDASQLFRGLSEPARNDYGTTEDIGQLADKYSHHSESSVSNITESLKDFTSIFSSFHRSTSSNISLSDVSSTSKNNIFLNDDARTLISKKGSINQISIFLQNMAHDGGLRYASIGSNIKDSARAFAAADIQAIEKSHNIAEKNRKSRGEPKPYDQEDEGKKDTKLTCGEARSSHQGLRDTTYSRLIHSVNLDKDNNSITKEEYAAYLIVADSLRYNDETGQYEFDVKNADGLISPEEAKLASKIDNKTFKGFAQDVYDNYISKPLKGLFDRAK